MNFSMMQAALALYAEKEVAGRRANPLIVRWLRAVGVNTRSDETAWCSAFVYEVASQCAAERPTEAAGLARSWLKVGEEVRLDHAAIGDVVVFKRGSKPWQGHVGLFVREKGNFIYVLGGNQRNSVNIAAYKKADLLGVRRLRSAHKAICGPE